MLRVPTICKAYAVPAARIATRSYATSRIPQPKDVKKIDDRSPSQIATSSTLNIEIPENKAPVKPKTKRPMLSDSKYEKEGYELSGFMKNIGESVISILRLDMDKIRAGPIAGSVYYAECKKQGLQFENEELSESAAFFYEDLKLPRTFSQWFQITALHQWMLSVRMRAMPFKYGRNYQQKLVDRFFRDMELRLNEEMNVNSSRITDQYLKDYNSQLRGLVCSYDEAFVTDDVTLAQALWRNLFNAQKNVDMMHLEAMVSYVRGQLYVLSKMSDRDFAFGKFKFVSPNEVVKRFTAEQEAEILKKAKEEYEPKEGKKILPSERSSLSYEN
ncbi:hypothetical protein WICANDRAFT_80213 [Wickerhamomyces anomalus NRRL Y-366-8]|uniref:Ubiquinol-cytochrome c chaperone domain-containing protein n=1 Tax=Wickerhamomyces anomalus (strain ATCC 58044 / CBS 1984 / NCYC 433 / NRRL Y-366-8) TaxID=683960 RepID=A0A1E3NY77_WICAA|nr:uncharacterized protein WICANDRAFT_80213 [Wickerhamomyces anomalus NRRL Y-366-8]ODQ58053.1 hypothetical protein WICANDRAFT_80213 [Wickerhamomyces anomalus NRRL Y-366-8]